MSLNNVYWGNRGHCPKCGKFCGDITGYGNCQGLQKVTGVCKIHGKVDLSKQDWGFDDFFSEEDER